jgi:hypothetical protein
MHEVQGLTKQEATGRLGRLGEPASAGSSACCPIRGVLEWLSHSLQQLPKRYPMKKLLSLFAVGIALSFGTAHAASHAGAPMAAGGSGCEAKAADKKLAGAAKASFMKKCEADSASPSAACEKTAADKKLAGAAKTSFMKKCVAESAGPEATCEKSAADKKLAGAAKTSHIKKCMEDSKPADAKPMAAAKPAASAKK